MIRTRLAHLVSEPTLKQAPSSIKNREFPHRGVYFVQIQDRAWSKPRGPIKIGKSNNVKQRLMGVSSGVPWNVVPLGWIPHAPYVETILYDQEVPNLGTEVQPLRPYFITDLDTYTKAIRGNIRVENRTLKFKTIDSLELWIHCVFSKHRMNGEWFTDCEPIAKFIQEHCYQWPQ